MGRAGYVGLRSRARSRITANREVASQVGAESNLIVGVGVKSKRALY